MDHYLLFVLLYAPNPNMMDILLCHSVMDLVLLLILVMVWVLME
jgi:hypothetical protein